MPEQQCLYEAQRRARVIRQVLFQQELRQSLGFPIDPKKPSCFGGPVSPLPYIRCAPSYHHTQPNFQPTQTSQQQCVPMQLRFKPDYTPLPPSIAPVCGNINGQFPASLPAGTNLAAYRESPGDPGFQSVSRDFSSNSCHPNCDYTANFRQLPTMVSPCPYPPVAPMNPLMCLRDGPVVGFTPNHCVINELTEDDCQKLGLCGSQRTPEFFVASPITLNSVKTSLPGLEVSLQYPPKPWRDPCGGRVYHRLANNDYFQQW